MRAIPPRSSSGEAGYLKADGSGRGAKPHVAGHKHDLFTGDSFRGGEVDGIVAAQRLLLSEGSGPSDQRFVDLYPIDLLIHGFKITQGPSKA